MSKNFEKVKRFFDADLWSEKWVLNAVGKWITVDEFQEITGKEYGQLKE